MGLSQNIDVPVVDAVVLSDDVAIDVGQHRIFEVRVLDLSHLQEGLPLLV